MDSTVQNILFLIILICTFRTIESIACYSCVSINGSDTACEDPIDASVPVQHPCRQTLQNHKGLFYAYYCSKIKGIRQKDGVSLLIRRCSMDKLADIPTHCGQFQLDDDLYHGCIATCSRDWCNKTISFLFNNSYLILCSLIISYLFTYEVIK